MVMMVEDHLASYRLRLPALPLPVPASSSLVPSEPWALEQVRERQVNGPQWYPKPPPPPSQLSLLMLLLSRGHHDGQRVLRVLYLREPPRHALVLRVLHLLLLLAAVPLRQPFFRVLRVSSSPAVVVLVLLVLAPVPVPVPPPAQDLPSFPESRALMLLLSPSLSFSLL
jgi:hypothetical protein